MSTCIYDDAPSVTVCPGCDFGVCQDCLDAGADGVCRECAVERQDRSENSAFQREFTVETPVRRCNFCRAAEDDVTALDEEGYCDACRSQPRCILHAELIAVGHCKSCRREYCRKCLGFTDVCQECTAKNKTKPLKEKAPSATVVPKTGKPAPKKGGKKTSPMEEPAPAAARGTKPKGTGTGPMKAGTGKVGPKGGRAAAEPDPGDGAKKKERKPSRGQAALQEKLQKKNAGRTRSQVIAAASVLAVGILLLVSGMYLHAMSPEEQARKIRMNMIAVHKGVVHFYKKTGKLPRSEDDIRGALDDLRVKGSDKISIVVAGRAPGSVIYNMSRAGFFIQGTDPKGQFIEDPPGMPVKLDQYYDSSSM